MAGVNTDSRLEIMDQFQQLQDINEKKATLDLAELKHAENQLSALQTQETIVKSFKSLVVYLDHKVTKTEVINQLEQIGTPDAIHVVNAVNELHKTLKTHQNTDLTEITSVMRELLDEAKQIPKSQVEIPEHQVVDYSGSFKSLESAVKGIEEVVKGQKLVAEAPVVNVPETSVHVEAPDLKPLQDDIKDVVTAVKDIVIPEYKTDNTEVEKLLKKSNKLLNELLDKPVSSGGGGGRVSPYEDSSGNPSFVRLVNGAIPSPELAVQIDAVAPITYIGKAVPGSATSAAVWSIKKIDETSGTFITWASGNANFNQIWDNRASLSYS